jgi:hypothetical protein
MHAKTGAHQAKAITVHRRNLYHPDGDRRLETPELPPRGKLCGQGRPIRIDGEGKGI